MMKSLCGIPLTEEEQLFIARTEDLIRLADRDYSPRFTQFLDERRQMLAETLMRAEGAEHYRFYGGYEGAVRKILSVYPEYCPPEDKDFPAEIVKFTFRSCDRVTHSQLLGTVMSLGIKRELTGDMIVEEGCAYAVLSPAAAAEARSISKIGGTGVKATTAAEGELVREQQFAEMSLSVSSLRLDCIISAACRISRGKAAEYIRSEGAEVNCVKVFSPDRTLNEGDVFSVRRHGKFIFCGREGQSRSGRTFITVKKYT